MIHKRIQIGILLFATVAMLCMATTGYCGTASSASYDALVVFNSGSNPVLSPNYGMRGVIGQNLADYTERLSRDAYFGLAPIFPLREFPSEYEIYDIQAFSFSSRLEIPPETWQRFNDLYFVWKIRPFTPSTLILGYSVAIDADPDDTIDTTYTYYDSTMNNFISDGRHAFYVKAATSGQVWSPVYSFEFWVDSKEPSAANFSPEPGTLITTATPTVTFNLSDDHSGLNLDSLQIYIDSQSISFSEKEGAISATPSNALADGKNTVRIRVEDMVGNLLNQVWGFSVDANKPVGSIVINGGEESTNFARVRLNLEASDATTSVTRMMLSSDGQFDSEAWEDFQPLRTDWVLGEPQNIGLKTVYCLFKDEAGNISTIYEDSIMLLSPAIDTVITSGPYSPTDAVDAQFNYQSTFSDALFSYKIDAQEWSDWSASTSASFSGLDLGNHIFSVKSAKDTNGDKLITVDEEDPLPAQWSWAIQAEAAPKEGERILYWRTE